MKITPAHPLFAMMLAGCYAYTPVDGAPRPGSDVRIQLTTGTAVRVSERLGRVTTSLDGIMVPSPQDSIALTLWANLAASQTRYTPTDTFRFARGDLLRVEEKRFSSSRTVLFAGGATALAVGLVAILWDRLGGSGGGGGGGGDN
jgi:hypothetical protein